MAKINFKYIRKELRGCAVAMIGLGLAGVTLTNVIDAPKLRVVSSCILIAGILLAFAVPE